MRRGDRGRTLQEAKRRREEEEKKEEEEEVRIEVFVGTLSSSFAQTQVETLLSCYARATRCAVLTYEWGRELRRVCGEEEERAKRREGGRGEGESDSERRRGGESRGARSGEREGGREGGAGAREGGGGERESAGERARERERESVVRARAGSKQKVVVTLPSTKVTLPSTTKVTPPGTKEVTGAAVAWLLQQVSLPLPSCAFPTPCPVCAYTFCPSYAPARRAVCCCQPR
eukprot:3813643-Rhodomonas_salina.1